MCTKLEWQRTKRVYDSGKTKGWGYTKSSDIGDESQYALMIKGSPNRVGRDQRSMDYAKSGDPEIGVVIKHREWVEGMEIGYWRSDIGVGTGSNKVREGQMWNYTKSGDTGDIVMMIEASPK